MKNKKSEKTKLYESMAKFYADSLDTMEQRMNARNHDDHVLTTFEFLNSERCRTTFVDHILHLVLEKLYRIYESPYQNLEDEAQDVCNYLGILNYHINGRRED